MRESRAFYFLITAGLVCLTLIVCTVVLSRSMVRIKSKDELIHVDGSARKPIRSDFIIWNGSLSQSATTIAEAYKPLEANVVKVRAYLLAKGVAAAEVTPDAVSEELVYEQVKNPRTGQYVATTKITGYTLTQTIEVKSHSVDLVDGLSRQSTALISQGIPFKSDTPLYLYTKLSNLKTTMQAEAAKNARDRAEQIAESSGCRLGDVRAAKMFVPQITPLYTSAQAGDGNEDDTTSLDKNITAVVSVDY
ncbi:MAG: SIMPL domain-containing protein [Janthinobacterium lividum]